MEAGAPVLGLAIRAADIERGDLRHALIHHDHAREERGIEQDHELGDLVDTAGAAGNEEAG
jgi:hypothetical protein